MFNLQGFWGFGVLGFWGFGVVFVVGVLVCLFGGFVFCLAGFFVNLVTVEGFVLKLCWSGLFCVWNRKRHIVERSDTVSLRLASCETEANEATVTS